MIIIRYAKIKTGR